MYLAQAVVLFVYVLTVSLAPLVLLLALHLVYLAHVLLLYLTISLPVGSVVGSDDKAHVHVAPVIVHLNTYVSIRQHTSAHVSIRQGTVIVHQAGALVSASICSFVPVKLITQLWIHLVHL